MVDLQKQIEVLLAKLNYEETLKDDADEYEEMIELLIWIGKCPDYALLCPYNDDGTHPNDALCTALVADLPDSAECLADYEAILGICI